MITIRKAETSDAKGIARVHVDSWNETYKGIIPDEVLDGRTYERQEKMWKGALAAALEDRAIFVAETDGGEVVGFITGGPNREPDKFDGFDAELYAVYVLKNAQGQGVGRKLTNSLTSFLGEKGYDSIMVWVVKDNPAVRFYARIGGRPIGKRTETMGGKEIEEMALGWDISE
ncbi:MULTISPECIES: GNAT family N-acetyltransferase [Alteribacter]|uniref:GNAT family N-acetyltransferase n=1 Tax=Alteribacter keqinensis TaxID=2483800 RepID=A0A3M7TNJ1_9BACI|nr:MULTISPECIES: GNAT family N-acetyltransferase [Alteribacter]MBM7095280.1 GNAT family N-acetyltransferase [Alteribacter salitolerans]RNA67022.1 GNAT family N-acetyltransferase [Alteribacter keqinensis]